MSPPANCVTTGKPSNIGVVSVAQMLFACCFYSWLRLLQNRSNTANFQVSRAEGLEARVAKINERGPLALKAG